MNSERGYGISGTAQAQTQTAPYVGIPNATPPPYPAWFGAMADAIKRVEDLCDRVDSVTSSLVGPPPPQTAGEAKGNIRAIGGMFGDLEDIANRVNQRVSWALGQLGRILSQVPKT